MHEDLASGRWFSMSLAEQMGNIGSEISRAIRWKNKGNALRVQSAMDRALELIDLSILWAQKPKVQQEYPGAIREFGRLREVVCDSYLGDNEFLSDAEKTLRYFDAFALGEQARTSGNSITE